MDDSLNLQFKEQEKSAKNIEQLRWRKKRRKRLHQKLLFVGSCNEWMRLKPFKTSCKIDVNFSL